MRSQALAGTGALLLLFWSAGCSKSVPASVAKTPPRVSNLNSHGLPKLTPQQIEEKIRAVQSSTTIPESAKANVIQSIRAQGEP